MTYAEKAKVTPNEVIVNSLTKGSIVIDVEIIVIDNCSTDKTWERVKEFDIKYENVKAFQNDKNIGPVENWYRGIQLAKGKYLKNGLLDFFL